MMMDIKTFFEKSEGKWFTQRTRYNLARQQVENRQAEVTVELLNRDNSDLQDLYNHAGSVPQGNSLMTLGGIKVSWDANDEKGSSFIAVIPEDEQLQKGQVIQKISNDHQSPTIGQFTLGEDEALTLSTQPQPHQLIKERLWFAHPNLRLRTVWQENEKEAGNQGWVIFYSEIRRLNS